MTNPEEALVSLLLRRGLKLATAESCTGGLIAKMITDVPGASAVYLGGVVSYANEVKENVLGVSGDDLASLGAVSRPVAEQMAKGAASITGADVAVSTTGIAGPGGGSAEKPVGLVYIAVSYRNVCVATENYFSGTRDEIRQKSAYKAMSLAAELIEKY